MPETEPSINARIEAAVNSVLSISEVTTFIQGVSELASIVYDEKFGDNERAYTKVLLQPHGGVDIIWSSFQSFKLYSLISDSQEEQILINYTNISKGLNPGILSGCFPLKLAWMKTIQSFEL